MYILTVEIQWLGPQFLFVARFPYMSSYILVTLSFPPFRFGSVPLNKILCYFPSWSFSDLSSHLFYHLMLYFDRRWGRSVSIVSDNRLNDRGSIPGRDKGFFLPTLCPDRLWSPLGFLSNGYRGSFSVGKLRPGCDAYHSLHLVPRSRMNRRYISSP
jgi:hypothetical protein